MFNESSALTNEGVEVARAAREEKSFGTGETKSGRYLKISSSSSSVRARNSSAKVIATVDITGLLYSGFKCSIYLYDFLVRLVRQMQRDDQQLAQKTF